MVKVCPVCYISSNTVVTVKGLNNLCSLGWNYYLAKDDDGKVYYDGYKNYDKIVMEKRTWSFLSSSKRVVFEMY